MKKIILSALFVLSTAVYAQQESITIHLSSTGDNTTADGTIGKPFTSINAGMDKYKIDSIPNPDTAAADTIPLVGKYNDWTFVIPSNEEISEDTTIVVPNHHKFAIVGDTNSELTFNGGRGILANKEAIQLVSLSNLTITGCDLQGEEFGGVLLMEGEELIVENCVFTGNQAASGSAITIGQVLKSTIRNCVFDNNISDTDARAEGGVVFINNKKRVLDPQAKLNTVIENCSFTNNTSYHDGMAIFSKVTHKDANYRFVNITNCTFANNARPTDKALFTSHTGVVVFNAGGVKGQMGTTSTWEIDAELVNNTIVNNDGSGIVIAKPNNANQYQNTSAILVNNVVVNQHEGINNDLYADDTNRYGEIKAQGNYIGEVLGVSEDCLADEIESAMNFNVTNGTFEATGLDSVTHTDRTIYYVPIVKDESTMLVNAGVDSYEVDGRELVPATDANGKTRSGATDIGAFEYAKSTGINNNTMTSSVKLKETLVSNAINFTNAVDNVIIFNSMGQRLMQSSNCNGVNISGLSTGNYIAIVTENSKQAALRFVKK